MADLHRFIGSDVKYPKGTTRIRVKEFLAYENSVDGRKDITPITLTFQDGASIPREDISIPQNAILNLVIPPKFRIQAANFYRCPVQCIFFYNGRLFRLEDYKKAEPVSFNKVKPKIKEVTASY